MRFAPVIGFGLFVVLSAPASAYTQEDTNACMNDAFRLCSAAIPNEHRVAACLYAKRRQLSLACASAFSHYSHVGKRRHHRWSRAHVRRKSLVSENE